MKKLGVGLIAFILMIGALIIYMVNSDNKHLVNSKNVILDKTNIEEVSYINRYGDYFIVMDLEYLYVLDSKYEELEKIDIKKIHQNDNNYDIIYSNKVIYYFNEYVDNNVLVYEYYDLYKYSLVKKVYVGDRDGK